jgi:hypothetical protein
MLSASCSTHTVILIIAIILMITFTDELFHKIPALVKLFTDPINFMLLIVLVILVVLIDLPCGILLSFLVLYISVYIKRTIKNKRDNFENILIASKLLNNSNPKVPSDIPKEYLSESEINYNVGKPFPNNNIAPFKPIDQQTIDNNTPQIATNICQNQQDSITTVNAPNRDGYDIAGCRYDFKDSKQNMTKYGPPLAACGAYNSEQAKTCGTLFYPLNA